MYTVFDAFRRPLWRTPAQLVGRPDAALEARAAAIELLLAEPGLRLDELLGLRVELESIRALLADRARLAGAA